MPLGTACACGGAPVSRNSAVTDIASKKMAAVRGIRAYVLLTIGTSMSDWWAPSIASRLQGRRSAAHTEVVILSVDVIVVTYNSAAEVAACLAAVRGSTHVERLIVVDNASSDGSAGAARRAGADLVLENERNVGFARAVNRGLEARAAECVLLLNPDAELREPALASMYATMRREAGAAIVAHGGIHARQRRLPQ